jgi:hypothetical protein
MTTTTKIITSPYSGKKLKRPEITEHFLRINRKMIMSKSLTDGEFRFLCLLMSYSNGTTITVKNLANKLNKTDMGIKYIIKELEKKKILLFSTATIELVLPSDVFEGKVDFTPTDESKVDFTETKVDFTPNQSTLYPLQSTLFSDPIEHIDNVNITDTPLCNPLNKTLYIDNTLSDKNSKPVGLPSGVENLSLGSESSKEVVLNQTIPTVKNDLELILNHSPKFRDIYDNAKWQTKDISKLSSRSLKCS